MYVDEVGNHDLKSADNPNERYFSLSGVIVEAEHYRGVIHPEMTEMKRRHFETDPDDPVILHRSDIVNRRGPFSVLKDEERHAAYNEDVLSALARWNYTVVSALIDKLALREQYSVWQYDPYHYCLRVLLERYSLMLHEFSGRGDVMAESRGGREDMRLKKSYTRIYNEGSGQIESQRLRETITSHELKVKQKSKNISGLQLADLIAHPSRRHMLRDYMQIKYDREVFGDHIIEILVESKYRRSRTGKIEGYGIKVLP